MRELFWRLIGGDPRILINSGKESQKWFFIIGVLYASLSIFTFTAFLGLFYGVLDSFMQALFGALILTFILQNMYRLILITLEPNTLPVVKEYKVKFWAYFVRLTVVFLIAVFVSKCIETMAFGHLVDDKVVEGLRGTIAGTNINQFDKSSYFVQHIIELNKHFPIVNGITLIFVFLYLVPVVIKHRLKKRKEYFNVKKKIDTHLVLSHYNDFRSYYTTLMKRLYKTKEKLYLESLMNIEHRSKDSSKSEFFTIQNELYAGKKFNYEYRPKYYDEPFNTKKIVELKSLESTKAFTDNF
jgi:hypothetical protein